MKFRWGIRRTLERTILKEQRENSGLVQEE